MTCLPLVLCFPLGNSYRSLIHSHKLLTSFNSHDIFPIKSVTLFPSSPFLTLKTSYIYKSFIKDMVFSISIWWPSSLIIPRASFSSSTMHHNHLVSTILLLSEIILPYSYCNEKGLVYITIASPTGHHFLLYAKCTKANMRSSCDVRFIFNTKYTLLISLHSLLVPYLIYYRVLHLNGCWEAR